MRYVKLHGALYNRAASDDDLAAAIADCIAGFDPTLTVLTLPGSTMASRAAAAGLVVAKEGFIDRAYERNGSLVPRGVEGSVIGDPLLAASRAVWMAIEGRVETIDGVDIPAEVDSLCVHGDSINALEMITAVRQSLESAGFRIRSFT